MGNPLLRDALQFIGNPVRAVNHAHPIPESRVLHAGEASECTKTFLRLRGLIANRLIIFK